MHIGQTVQVRFPHEIPQDEKGKPLPDLQPVHAGVLVTLPDTRPTIPNPRNANEDIPNPEYGMAKVYTITETGARGVERAFTPGKGPKGSTTFHEIQSGSKTAKPSAE